MTPELLAALTVFVLAILCGFAVISKVPATLHTPLMSGANSIHGIVLVGSMLIAASATDLLSQILSLLAVAFATMNVVGGYVVTDRMLQMFRKKPTAAEAGATEGRGLTRGRHRSPRPDRLAHRSRILRPRPDADELARHGPQRQPAVGGRHGHRDRRHRRPPRGQRQRLGDRLDHHRGRHRHRRRARASTPPGP